MWINRRVETIELLTHEETRRRVSIDFTLLPELQRHLELDDGVAVPIAVLTKEPRRKFDLRDESGRAVPVLGRTQNGELAHLALLSAALDALGSEPPGEIFEDIAAHLRRIVVEPPPVAAEQLAYFIGSAEEGDELRAPIWSDATCRQLLVTLWQNYVLYAVVDASGASRRILKYSYAEDFAYAASQWGWRDQLARDGLSMRIDRPDRARFVIDCPDAARAASFHVEIATPEELRFEFAVLLDTTADEQLSEADQNVDRASLYACRTVPRGAHVQAYVEIAPERHGRTFQAAATSVVVALLLWLGVASGLDSDNPGAAVSILLAGAAIFSGLSASRGTHKLVRIVFAGTSRWLAAVTLAALTASATLAMEFPARRPVSVWLAAAIVCTLAAGRLGWSALRAPK